MLYSASTGPNRESARLRSIQQANVNPEQLVYVLDQNQEVRSAVCQLLITAGYTIWPFASPESLLSSSMPVVPSCLILDQAVGSADLGMKVLGCFTRDLAASVIVLGEATDLPSVVRAIRSGATEFISKPIVPELLLTAVRSALDEVAHRWIDTCRNRELRNRYATLTPRERQILPYVVTGYLNKQTAYELGTSEVTIRIHRGQIMRKMAVESLADLVRSAVRIGVSEL